MGRELCLEARGDILRYTYIGRRAFQCVHYRRMDQVNHNLLMAVGGWVGVLLPPPYRTAVLEYLSVP